MRIARHGLTTTATLLAMAAPIYAEIIAYTDETAFLNGLAVHGFEAIHEGFESDAVWGGVRTPQTAASVSNLGITWMSSSANNAITTGVGAARRGQWGIYSLPHGDYANGITDGWRGIADDPLVAIGGWVRTNTPPAALELFLDNDAQHPVDFGGQNALVSGWYYFGVINTDGFLAFDFRESEGTIGDQKLIFGDEFTFAFDGAIVDCNENGVADGFDIAGGTSPDCNNNIIPDECEIDIDSDAPGGPFYCTDHCAPDCDNNGVPDECDVVTDEVYASGELSPIGVGSPQSFTIVSPPDTRADAILTFTAYANLGGNADFINVEINKRPVGTVFGPNGSDCPERQPDAAQLVVPMEIFNQAVNGGNAVIHMVTSAEVTPDECDLPTYVTVEVRIFVPSGADLNGDGVPDVCESCGGDFDGDGDADLADHNRFVECFTGPGGGPLGTQCECGDFDEDADEDLADFAAFLARWTIH